MDDSSLASFLDSLWQVADRAPDIGTFRNTMIESLAGFVDFDSSTVIPAAPWVGEDERTGAVNVGMADDLFERYLRNRHRYYISLHPLIRAVARSGTPVVDADVLERSERIDVYREVLLPAGITCTLVAPLSFRGRMSGVLAINRHGSAPRYDERDVARLRRVLPALGVADAALLGRCASTTPAFPNELLTPREQEVAQLLLAGLLNKQIAAALGTSMDTVRKQTIRIYEKLGVEGRTDLIRKFPCAPGRAITA